MTDLEIIFLGTGASIPTARRSLPAIVIRRKDELIAFDFGEGAQRNMMLTKLGLNRKMKILISHLHADHLFGIPGLIHSMSLMDRRRKLEIYGPRGAKQFIEAVLKTVRFTLRFPIRTYEVGGGLVCREREYEIRAAWADHLIPTLAYALIEAPRPGKFYPEKAIELGIPKGPLWSRLQRGFSVRLESGQVVKPRDVMGPPRRGRKIVYSSDTRPSPSVIELAREADVLIHDATFEDALGDRAGETGHSTAAEAARIAKEAGVRQLVLTHISARYDDASILAEEARRIFPNVIVAEDLMRIPVPHPE